MYGGEGGGYCHVSQIYERQQFEVVKGDFWLECLTIFATGCSSIGRGRTEFAELFFPARKMSEIGIKMYCLL